MPSAAERRDVIERKASAAPLFHIPHLTPLCNHCANLTLTLTLTVGSGTSSERRAPHRNFASLTPNLTPDPNPNSHGGVQAHRADSERRARAHAAEAAAELDAVRAEIARAEAEAEAAGRSDHLDQGQAVVKSLRQRIADIHANAARGLRIAI